MTELLQFARIWLIKVIKKEYNLALEQVERLMHLQDRSPEQSALLELLVLLIETYENAHYSIDAADPQDVLLHRMEANGVRQIDLVGVLESKGVVSDVVNGKRSISKAQAKALAAFFGVSVSAFI